MGLKEMGNKAIAAVVFLSLSEKYSTKNKHEADKITDMVNDIADEQLAVDNLDSDSLTLWFRKNNSDGSLKNVLVYPDKIDLKDKKIIKLFGKEDLNADNMIIQVLLDKKNNVTLCRSVEFEEILPKLEKLFDDNDGVMIVK